MHMHHVYLYKIMIFKKKKLGSTKDHIFTSCVFDAESKTGLCFFKSILPRPPDQHGDIHKNIYNLQVKTPGGCKKGFLMTPFLFAFKS